MGVQIGEGGTQINYYYYGESTWADGVPAPPLAGVSGVIDSPYRGLSAFEERDAAFFFGREAAATRVLKRMSQQLGGTGLLMVSGVSGAGKSSLLRAGVLPRLRGTGLASAPGSASWPCLLFTPARAPLDELAVRISRLAGTDAAGVRRGLDADPAGFALTARQAAAAQPADPARDSDISRPVRRLLLVVDQFEQLFTQCPDEKQQQAFIAALHAAATVRNGPEHEPAALVVLGVRADFEARCADYPQLADAVQDRYLLTAMTERQLRMAITEPAKIAGSSVDDDLADVLLREVRARHQAALGAGVLPLLSHALDQAWRSRTGNTLTLADYERTGGIEGALADSAQRAYDHLTPAQQATARQVFIRLTATSSDGVDTASRAERAELTERMTAVQAQDVEAVLEAFAAERLLVLAAGTVEICHEILLTAWPLLHDTWLAETYADRVVRTRLHNSAAEWTRSSRDPTYLYAGSLLETATETAARIEADPARHPPLSQTERDFLHASERAASRSSRQRRGAVALLAVLALVASVVSVFAFSQRSAAVRQSNQAIRNQNQAIYNQTVAEAIQFGTSDTSLAAQLNLAAYRMQRTSDEASRLLNTENTPLSFLLAAGTGPNGGSQVPVVFSRDGRTLASGNTNGTIRLWDVSNPTRPRPLGHPLTDDVSENILISVALSPDGHTLAAGYNDSTIRLWDIADPTRPRPLGHPLTSDAPTSGGPTVVAFSPDSRTLASGNTNGAIWLRDVSNPVRPRLLGKPLASSTTFGVNSVVFSRDGRTLISGNDDGTIRLWDVTDLGRPDLLGRPLTSSTSASGPTSVMLNPNGRTLVSTDGDTIRLWDLTGPTRPRPQGQQLTIGTGTDVMALSPDSRTLASDDADGNIRLWDLTDPSGPRQLGQPLASGTVASVNSLAFSPDGRTLASTNYDGTLRLWSLPDTVLIDTGDDVNSVARSPDGRILASGDHGGMIRLWDVSDPAHPRPLGQPLISTNGLNDYGVHTVAFSPDGRTLAGGNDNGTIRLWDVSDPAHPRALSKLLTSGLETSVAFTPDGHTLAGGDGNSEVWLWDITDPARPHPLGQPLASEPQNSSSVIGQTSVAISPDGRTLAGGNDDGTIRLWDITSPARPRPLGHPLTSSTNASGAYSVAFSPGGRTLASGNGDGTVRLWDITSRARPRPLGQPLASSTSVSGFGADSVAFSPDGRTLASGNDDGTIRLWDITSPVRPHSLGQPLTSGIRGNAVYSVAFSPDGHTLASGTSDGTIPLWNLNVGYAIERICTTAGTLTPRQWHKYISPLPYQSLCMS